MKRHAVSRLAGALALVSLALCLAVAVLFFLGRIPEGTFKLSFLLASIAWFVLATGGKMAGRDEGPTG